VAKSNKDKTSNNGKEASLLERRPTSGNLLCSEFRCAVKV
jgi:hypothetical protein